MVGATVSVDLSQGGSNACLGPLAMDGDCSLDNESLAVLARSEISGVKDLHVRGGIVQLMVRRSFCARLLGSHCWTG